MDSSIEPKKNYRIGYAMIRDPSDDFRPQLNKLEQLGCQKIYQDIFVSASSERPGLSDLIMNVANSQNVSIYCHSFFFLFNSVEAYLPFMELLVEKKSKIILINEGITIGSSDTLLNTIWNDLLDFKVKHRARRRAKPNKKIVKDGT